MGLYLSVTIIYMIRNYLFLYELKVLITYQLSNKIQVAFLHQKSNVQYLIKFMLNETNHNLFLLIILLHLQKYLQGGDLLIRFQEAKYHLSMKFSPFFFEETYLSLIYLVYSSEVHLSFKFSPLKFQIHFHINYVKEVHQDQA